MTYLYCIVETTYFNDDRPEPRILFSVESITEAYNVVQKLSDYFRLKQSVYLFLKDEYKKFVHEYTKDLLPNEIDPLLLAEDIDREWKNQAKLLLTANPKFIDTDIDTLFGTLTKYNNDFIKGKVPMYFTDYDSKEIQIIKPDDHPIENLLGNWY
mgnify:FL=1